MRTGAVVGASSGACSLVEATRRKATAGRGSFCQSEIAVVQVPVFRPRDRAASRKVSRVWGGGNCCSMSFASKGMRYKLHRLSSSETMCPPPKSFGICHPLLVDVRRERDGRQAKGMCNTLGWGSPATRLERQGPVCGFASEASAPFAVLLRVESYLHGRRHHVNFVTCICGAGATSAHSSTTAYYYAVCNKDEVAQRPAAWRTLPEAVGRYWSEVDRGVTGSGAWPAAAPGRVEPKRRFKLAAVNRSSKRFQRGKF